MYSTISTKKRTFFISRGKRQGTTTACTEQSQVPAVQAIQLSTSGIRSQFFWDFPRSLGHMWPTLSSIRRLPSWSQLPPLHGDWCFCWLSPGTSISTARVPHCNWACCRISSPAILKCQVLASLHDPLVCLNQYPTRWLLQSLAASKVCSCIWTLGGTPSMPESKT